MTLTRRLQLSNKVIAAKRTLEALSEAFLEIDCERTEAVASLTRMHNLLYGQNSTLPDDVTGVVESAVSEFAIFWDRLIDSLDLRPDAREADVYAEITRLQCVPDAVLADVYAKLYPYRGVPDPMTMRAEVLQGVESLIRRAA